MFAIQHNFSWWDGRFCRILFVQNKLFGEVGINCPNPRFLNFRFLIARPVSRIIQGSHSFFLFQTDWYLDILWTREESSMPCVRRTREDFQCEWYRSLLMTDDVRSRCFFIESIIACMGWKYPSQMYEGNLDMYVCMSDVHAYVCTNICTSYRFCKLFVLSSWCMYVCHYLYSWLIVCISFTPMVE